MGLSIYYALEVCEDFIPDHCSNERMFENKLNECLKAKFEIDVLNCCLVGKIILNKKWQV